VKSCEVLCSKAGGGRGEDWSQLARNEMEKQKRAEEKKMKKMS